MKSFDKNKIQGLLGINNIPLFLKPMIFSNKIKVINPLFTVFLDNKNIDIIIIFFFLNFSNQ